MAGRDGTGGPGPEREVSPAELVDGAITRIEKLNPRLNAVIHPLFDRARAEAAGPCPTGHSAACRSCSRTWAPSWPGRRSTRGSDFSGDYHSTVTQELTQRYIGPASSSAARPTRPSSAFCRPPSPGASGRRATHGTPSTRRADPRVARPPRWRRAWCRWPTPTTAVGPSASRPSCCGLVGLKPTRARNSWRPQYGDLMGGLVAEHVVTRSVRDSAAVLDAMAGPVPGDPYWAPPLRGPSFAAAAATAPPPLRIAVMTASPTGSEVAPGLCRRGHEAAAALCESLGHRVEVCHARRRRRRLHRATSSTSGPEPTPGPSPDWEARMGRTAPNRTWSR